MSDRRKNIDAMEEGFRKAMEDNPSLPLDAGEIIVIAKTMSAVAMSEEPLRRDFYFRMREYALEAKRILGEQAKMVEEHLMKNKVDIDN